jgi:hypothetical protein
MEAGKSTNYWPGFVDALTNVVIAMVFVIVVLAIALSFAAQLMGKRLAQQIIDKHQADAQAAASHVDKAHTVSQAHQLHETAQAHMSEDPPSNLSARTVIKVKAEVSAGAAAGGRVEAINNLVRLDYPDSAVMLDADAVQTLRAALASQKAQGTDVNVLVLAMGHGMELSENQRAAYMRVLTVRNELIDHGFKPENIIVRIDTETDAPRASVSVSFQKKP